LRETTSLDVLIVKIGAAALGLIKKLEISTSLEAGQRDLMFAAAKQMMISEVRDNFGPNFSPILSH